MHTCVCVCVCVRQLLRCCVVIRQQVSLSASVIRKALNGFSAINCDIDIMSLIGHVCHALLNFEHPYEPVVIVKVRGQAAQPLLRFEPPPPSTVT